MSGLLRKGLILLAAAAALVGCGGSGGGGGSDSGGGGATPPAKTIALKLVRVSDGQETTTISSSQPGKVVATVTNGSANELVTFGTTIGTLDSTTALTSGNEASVVIRAGSTPGAGTITATLNDGTTGSLNFAVGAANIRIGSSSSGSFQEGVISITPSSLSAGGTAALSVELVDDSGSPFTDPVTVAFASGCSQQSSPKATINSPIVTVNGVAQSTYKAQGCVGDDTVTATANVGGTTLSASAKITIAAASVGSVQFVSASPINVALRGTGGAGRSEVSNVDFKVLDSFGNPVNGAQVRFSLDTDVGGVSVTPNASAPPAVSDSDGLVRAVVTGGTVATPVRVTAQLVSNPAIATISDQLVVSTGIPTQGRFSIAVSSHNPEAFDVDGVAVTVTARLADHFGNPAPIGTAVSFRTETGGSIDPQCNTGADGSCQVTWRSQGQRPTDGRVTILATALGEEDFVDVNSNGRFDGAETAANFTDLPEAFLDVNENNAYDSGTDEFVDLNQDGLYSPASGKYNGVLCINSADAATNSGIIPVPSPSLQCDKSTINVRQEQVIVMSSSAAGTITITPNPITVPAGGEQIVDINVADVNGQTMTKGTTITCVTTNGSLVGDSSFAVPDQTAPGNHYQCTVKGDNTPSTGSFRVKVTSPSGLTTTSSAVSLTD